MSEAPERTAVYRVRGEADVLLYIGMTNGVPFRWNAHQATQPWWGELRSLTVEWYDSRPEAEAAEKAAIKAEVPKYNVTYLRSAFPDRKRRVARPVLPLPEVVLEPQADDEDLLTMTEVAEKARITESVLRMRINRGDGPDGFRVGKQLVFRKGKVRAWMRAIEASQRQAGAA